MKNKKLLFLVIVPFLCGMFFCLWQSRNPTEAEKKTNEAVKSVVVTIDECLSAIVPQRVKETQERTVKAHEEVRQEAAELSGDALSIALNLELRLFDNQQRRR